LIIRAENKRCRFRPWRVLQSVQRARWFGQAASRRVRAGRLADSCEAIQSGVLPGCWPRPPSLALRCAACGTGDAARDDARGPESVYGLWTGLGWRGRRPSREMMRVQRSNQQRQFERGGKHRAARGRAREARPRRLPRIARGTRAKKYANRVQEHRCRRCR